MQTCVGLKGNNVLFTDLFVPNLNQNLNADIKVQKKKAKKLCLRG
jgi:hypothetical protein